jgi:hypothetical protein
LGVAPRWGFLLIFCAAIGGGERDGSVAAVPLPSRALPSAQRLFFLIFGDEILLPHPFGCVLFPSQSYFSFFLFVSILLRLYSNRPLVRSKFCRAERQGVPISARMRTARLGDESFCAEGKHFPPIEQTQLRPRLADQATPCAKSG